MQSEPDADDEIVGEAVAVEVMSSGVGMAVGKNVGTAVVCAGLGTGVGTAEEVGAAVELAEGAAVLVQLVELLSMGSKPSKHSQLKK